jgi:predicted transcriptional regulator
MRTMVWLDEDVHTRLKHIAVDRRTSLAALVRQALAEFLKRHGKGKGGADE